MEDKAGIEIKELLDNLEAIAQLGPFDDYQLLTPHIAGLILENERRHLEQIDMLNGAIEGWRRTNAELEDTIKKAVAHLKTCDDDALGRDPQEGWSYLQEMISHFEKAIEPSTLKEMT